jgi:hypothetical protein
MSDRPCVMQPADDCSVSLPCVQCPEKQRPATAPEARAWMRGGNVPELES